MSSPRLLSAVLLASVLLALACEAAPRPFFDAIYDAINGNAQRSYGYSGYGGYQRGYYYPSYATPRRTPAPQRKDKTWNDICRVHFPDSFAVPGKGGIVC